MSVSPIKRQSDKPVIEIRRHWAKLVGRALIPGVLTALCWLMSILFFTEFFALAPDLSEVLGQGTLLLSLIPSLWFLLVCYDWTNDYLIVTKTHIVHYEQQYFFPQRTQIVPLDQVRGILVYSPNVVLKWLNVGIIDIETAGQEGLIHFDIVKDPQRVQKRILELSGRQIPSRRAAGRSVSTQADQAGSVLVQRRHHWLRLIRQAWFPCVLIVASWLSVQILLPGTSRSIPDENHVLGLVLGAALSALPIAWIVIVYHDWLKDHLIITKDQVVHHDQRYVFWRRTHAISIPDIADVSVRFPDSISKRLDVGEVIVEKSGQGAVIRFDMVQDPRNLQNRILKLMGRPALPEPSKEPLSPTGRILSVLQSVVPIYPINTPDGGVILHRHPFILFLRTLVPGTLTALAWLGTGVLVFNGLTSQGPGAELSLIGGSVLLVVSVVLTLWFVAIYHDWVNDYLSINRDQIVHYEQHYILSRDTRVVLFGQVQNVRVRIPNIVFRWLNAGDVIIDTAGRKGDITFTAVNNPRGIQDTIFRLRGGPRPTTPTTGGEVQKTMVEQFFERFLPVYLIRTSEGWLIFHRHPFVLAERIFWPLLLDLVVLLGLVLFIILIQPLLPVEVANLMGGGLVLVSTLIWIASLGWKLYVYQDWKDDYWIITDTHIIDVVARPFPYMSEDRRQARLQDLVNVRIETPSLWARFINMGNVFAETAGEAENFKLEQMMDPRRVQDALERQRAEARVREQGEKEQQRLAERAEFMQQAIEAAEQVQQVQWEDIREEVRTSQEEFQRNVIELLNQRKGRSS